MQHIPYTNPDDVERDRQEMQAFRKELDNEKHVWPNLTLTGEDIHRAFCVATPDSKHWAEVPEIAKQHYNNVAQELNRELDARQAWFEGEDSGTSDSRCPRCGGMFTNFKLKEHPCL